jgi:hypothetical protein
MFFVMPSPPQPTDLLATMPSRWVQIIVMRDLIAGLAGPAGGQSRRGAAFSRHVTQPLVYATRSQTGHRGYFSNRLGQVPALKFFNVRLPTAASSEE